jgi:outer membrane protein OmpA-like peptidoglycan-associated protein
MTHRAFTVVLLSTAIALPAFAQQSSSGAAAQPAASAATATGQPPLRHEQQNWWDGDQPGIWWLVAHPFSSKSYVRRQTQPISDRIDELNQLTTDNSKGIQDVDSRASQGIQLASNKVKEADDHALDASNKAQLATQTANSATTRVGTAETVVGGLDQYKSLNQTVIKFRSGQSALSKNAKDALDDMAGAVKDQRGYIIEIQGFSTSRGQSGIAASQKMANSVMRYLVLNHDIPAYRIYVVGMGNAPIASADATAKPAGGNRVEVSVLKNDVDQLASSSAQQ